MGTIDVDTLSDSQAARRQRVLTTAMALADEGGYEAVQMRYVASRADVALGTIYRYFDSKDHLLAAAMNEWIDDLGEQIGRRPLRGDEPAERVVDVLTRALRALGRRPSLAAAVITAQTSGDVGAGLEQARTIESINRILASAFPNGTDPDRLVELTRVLGHVWFSCLIAWANGVRDIEWVAGEVEVAARLLVRDS